MQDKEIISQLNDLRAHAAALQNLATEILRNIETPKKERRGRGLSSADRARLDAHRMKSILKK